jgi:hypothetical protein
MLEKDSLPGSDCQEKRCSEFASNALSERVAPAKLGSDEL